MYRALPFIPLISPGIEFREWNAGPDIDRDMSPEGEMRSCDIRIENIALFCAALIE